MITANTPKAVRIDTHRLNVCDGSCEQACGCLCVERHKVQRRSVAQPVRKVKRARGEAAWWLVMRGLQGLGLLFASWAFACVFHPGARPW